MYTIYQIDAFAHKAFEGNPAAVVPLDTWIEEETMQSIAMENNLSETAFFVASPSGYELRWFTPTCEVDMCGHATLATAFVVFECLGYDKDSIHFETKSGRLSVTKEDDLLVMDFPVQTIEPSQHTAIVSDALGVEVLELYESMDYIAVVASQAIVEAVSPDLEKLKKVGLRGIAVTAKGDNYDFVSRFFAPKYGINEDPVTGSAYTQLLLLWSQKLNQSSFHTKQLSARGGEVWCELQGERCSLKGKAVKYLEGTISI